MSLNKEYENKEKDGSISWSKYLEITRLNRTELCEKNCDTSSKNSKDNSSLKLDAIDKEFFGFNVHSENDFLGDNLFLCTICRKVIKLPKVKEHSDLHAQEYLINTETPWNNHSTVISEKPICSSNLEYKKTVTAKDVKLGKYRRSIDSCSPDLEVDNTYQNSCFINDPSSSIHDAYLGQITLKTTVSPQASSSEELPIEKYSSNTDHYSYSSIVTSNESNCSNLEEEETVKMKDIKLGKHKRSDTSNANLDLKETNHNSYCNLNSSSLLMSSLFSEENTLKKHVTPKTLSKKAKLTDPNYFDSNIHCGVLIEENKPCVKKIFSCREHKLAHKRNVPRLVSFDQLVMQSKKQKNKAKKVPSSKTQPQVNQQILHCFPNNLHIGQTANNYFCLIGQRTQSTSKTTNEDSLDTNHRSEQNLNVVSNSLSKVERKECILSPVVESEDCFSQSKNIISSSSSLPVSSMKYLNSSQSSSNNQATSVPFFSNHVKNGIGSTVLFFIPKT